MPSGKTNKDILFDLHPYIIWGGNDKSNNSGPSDDDDDNKDIERGNEDFVDSFTLSRFWKDLMMLANEKYPEKYDISKNSMELGVNCFFKSNGICQHGRTCQQLRCFIGR